MLKIRVDAMALAKNKARGRSDPPILVLDEATGETRRAHHVELGEGVRIVHETPPGCCGNGSVYLVVDDPALARIVR